MRESTRISTLCRITLAAAPLGILCLVSAFAFGPGAADAAKTKKGKLSAISKEDYDKIFLGPDDMLPTVKMTHDNRHRGADPGDRLYVQLGGLHSGSTVWHAKERGKGAIDRSVDIRWVFPSAAAAKKYLQDQLGPISEGMRPVKALPKIGVRCFGFGGIYDSPFAKARSYIFAFRKGNVVVKFFAWQDDANGQLGPETMAELCRKIVRRIKETAR